MKMNILNFIVLVGFLAVSFSFNYSPKKAISEINAIPANAEKKGDHSANQITYSIYEVLKVANQSDNEHNKDLKSSQEDAIAKLLYLIEPVTKINSSKELKANLETIVTEALDMVQDNVAFVSQGIKPGDFVNSQGGFSYELNNFENNNTIEPDLKIYPKANSKDPGYSVSEEKLRSSIHIPFTFQFEESEKEPVLFIPATGVPGGMTYYYTLRKSLNSTSLADPIWLNDPDHMLSDIQTSAEYIAYAINYIAGITQKNVTIISLSQGNLASQWLLRYWKSARSKVNNFIAISPDFHGTTKNVGCPPPNTTGCPPAALQKTYHTNFVNTLWKNGGGSALVPTTIVYSSDDQVVSPKKVSNSSFSLNDEYKAGVNLNDVKELCKDKPAGDRFFHESMVYNPLVHELTIDAIKHKGPGNVDRIDLDSVCQKYLHESLRVEDAILSEAVDIRTGIHTLSYYKKTKEPAVKEYAKTNTTEVAR